MTPPSPRVGPLWVSVVDRLNRRFGRGTVFVGSVGVPERDASGAALDPAWAMRREHMSPRFTTRWDELVVVYVR